MEFDSPFVLDHRLFMKLTEGTPIHSKISPQEKTLLSSTNNEVIFEVSNYESDGRQVVNRCHENQEQQAQPEIPFAIL